MPSRKPFIVSTKPTKQVVVSSLTKDATVRACIFDLIDNSIDAARNRIFKDLAENQSRNLPDSFEGFRISLQLNGSGLKIQDNCGGITVDDLRDMVLRFGRVSSHELGIGVFGVGLNRAIFKLGRTAHLKTDTGNQRAELVLNIEQYIADDDNWDLPAEEFESSGQIGTELEIRQPPEEISQEFADSNFAEKIRAEIGRRYGRFISKNLSINVNGVPVTAREVSMRENGPFPIENKFYRTPGGVDVYIKVGEHSEHRFSGENGYDREKNKQLTEEYGWTVYCNDRAIIVADTTRTTGWDTKFHSEFYGFVASVSFVAADPSKLPWLTTKTDVDLNNAAYKAALDDMRKFAERWRTFTDRYKKNRKAQSLAIPPAPQKRSEERAPHQTTEERTKSPTPSTKPATGKVGHNSLRYVLPEDISEHHCNDKFLEIVREAKSLDIGVHPYAGLALIRMLFEFSVTIYMIRVGKDAELKDFAMTKRSEKSGKAITSPNSFSPRLEEVLAYLQEHPETWGPLKANHVKTSINKLAKQSPLINGALHNPFQAVHRSLVFQIRDESLHALRHLIEQPFPTS
ncbi:MAG: ATP-binding protein [Oceanicaulis sp.]|nr:ATP-binding protein [Oceanicaulis sp.]